MLMTGELVVIELLQQS